jgi:hypothetical protein
MSVIIDLKQVSEYTWSISQRQLYFVKRRLEFVNSLVFGAKNLSLKVIFKERI